MGSDGPGNTFGGHGLPTARGMRKENVMKTALFWKWARIGLLTAALAVSPLWQTPAEETDIHGHGPGYSTWNLPKRFTGPARRSRHRRQGIRQPPATAAICGKSPYRPVSWWRQTLRILAQQEKIIQLLDRPRRRKSSAAGQSMLPWAGLFRPRSEGLGK